MGWNMGWNIWVIHGLSTTSVGSPSSHDLASDMGSQMHCDRKCLKCRSSMISWWFNSLQRWPFFHRRTDDSRRSAYPSFDSNVNPGSISSWPADGTLLAPVPWSTFFHGESYKTVWQVAGSPPKNRNPGIVLDLSGWMISFHCVSLVAHLKDGHWSSLWPAFLRKKGPVPWHVFNVAIGDDSPYYNLPRSIHSTNLFLEDVPKKILRRIHIIKKDICL